VTKAGDSGKCDPSNTHCEVTLCKSDWTDDNHAGTDGCEHYAGPPHAPTAEICDGLDNDNDGVADETGPPPDGIDGTADPLNPNVHIGDACGMVGGECVAGRYMCRDGRVECLGGRTPAREVCDGLDNDCNGYADDDKSSPGGLVCSGGTRCAKLGVREFRCLSPCAGGEFPCPTGTLCTSVPLSGQTDAAMLCAPSP
jgi:hypothetical protein